MEPTYRVQPLQEQHNAAVPEQTERYAWPERGLDGERNECSHIKKQRSRSLIEHKRLQLARHISSTWQGNSLTVSVWDTQGPTPPAIPELQTQRLLDTFKHYRS